MPLAILGLDDLAATTGRRPDWWRRHWLRMHEQHGFPRKLPGLWGWPRLAVEAWVAAEGAGFSSHGQPSAANQNLPDDLAAAQARLNRRFGLA